MIQKNLYWENFLKMFQNGPIRKVITKKVIFEDFLIFSPAVVGHPGSTLRKILEDFSKKSQVRNSHYLFSTKYRVPGHFHLLTVLTSRSLKDVLGPFKAPVKISSDKARRLLSREKKEAKTYY